LDERRRRLIAFRARHMTGHASRRRRFTVGCSNRSFVEEVILLKQRAILHALCAQFGACLCLAAPVHAAENANLPDWAPKPKPHIVEDRFRAEVSLLGAAFDTQLRIDPTATLQGTQVSAEEDLALDDAQYMILGELTLLPGDHHLVRLSGLTARRSAQTILERGIVFEDDVYFRGERIDSELNLTMFGLTYGYRFIASERAELAASFGIQVAEVEANAVVRSRVVRDAESGVAPLPLIGLEGRFDFTARWSAEVRIQYLTANIEDVDGSIMDARAAIAWRTNPHLLFALGYRSLAIDIDSQNESTPGFVEMKISGPMLFIRASL
jgi:hypothetical protein